MKSWIFLLLAAGVLTNAAEFPALLDTEADPGAPISPAAAAAAMKLPPGFRCTVFAAEPDVRQPIAMTLDTRGRLWVAEGYTYAEQKLGYDLRQRDRIIILEDTNHDGKFDKRTVFWDGAQRLTSIEVGFGGVWATCLPNLVFIPDRNGDDVPDGEPEVKLDGFDHAGARHTMANGLKWGPDGWLYGRQGILGTSKVGPPGTPSDSRVSLNVGIWRYHPTRHTVEAVTYGTTNPWGLDWNGLGEAFHINTVIGHLWHAIPGAHFRRMFGDDPTPRVYRLIEQHADHVHWDTREIWSDVRKIGVSPTSSQAGGGHAHTGLMIYNGDNWPPEYRGKLFTINYHGRRLNMDRLEREGSGYVGRHGADFGQSADPWFRGIDLIYGPDGGVFVSDWSDTGECHDHDGVHRSSGRIYKITYGETKAPAVKDVAKLNDMALLGLLKHTNEWWARQARRQWQERAVAGQDMTLARTQLRSWFQMSLEPVTQLRALWSLHAAGGADSNFLRGQLEHTNEHVRAWAIRLLLDDASVAASDPSIGEALAVRATRETSAFTRLALASALQRLPLAQRPAVAAPLLAREEDAGDHNLPLLLWYGLEPLGALHAESLARLATNCALPVTRQNIARRLGEEIERQPGPLNELLSIATTNSAAFQTDVLTGLSEALAGWRKAPQPSAWADAKAAFEKSESSAVVALGRDLGAVFGDGRALDAVREIALDAKRDLPARRAALRGLIDARPADLRAICEKLFDTHDLSAPAAEGLALDEDPAIAAFIIGKYGALYGYERPPVMSTLISRPAWAAQVLEAVAAKRVPRGDISVFHARQIRGFGQPVLTARLREVWGEARETSGDQTAQIAKWKEKLSPEKLAKADRAAGRVVFQSVCGVCHQLYNDGKAIGPDLTGSGRDNLDYLLQNIIDPAAVVPADYRLTNIEMKDGRSLTGVVRSRGEKIIALQTINESVNLETAEVKEIKQSELSLMPEGLLDALDEAQARDLIGYLMSKEPPPADR